jgi:MarR family transcriptional regulator, organic hydroperoxide resistance regulator
MPQAALKSVSIDRRRAPSRTPLEVAAPPVRTEPVQWGGLKNLLGFQMRQAQAALSRDFIATLRHLDLTQRQFAALALVEANPGISQIAISNALEMDRATVMAIIRRLELRGCIGRRRAGDDRRRQELTLTDGGKVLMADARKAIAVHEGHFTSRFSADEVAGFKALLSRIAST